MNKQASVKSPFANLSDSDLKVVGKIVSATTKAVKASEALNAALGEAYNLGLHTKSGYSNFGRWAEDATAAKGSPVGKSTAYKAVKIAEVRKAAPAAHNLPDTVVAKIAESAPMGNPESVAAFVEEVIASGGTVDTVRNIAAGEDIGRDPADTLAEDFARRIVRLCKGDALRADALLNYAASEVKRLLIEATKASK